MSDSNTGIESTMQETRLFPPSAAFSANAHVKSMDEYKKLYRQSIDHPETFWGDVAEKLHWFKKWDTVLKWETPDVQWFVGGKTNMAHNCLDHQVNQGRGDKTAILWEGEPMSATQPPEVRRISYSQLKDEVCRFANGLKKLGVRKGDRVTIYLPQIPEAAVAMLACANRRGAFSRVWWIFEPVDLRSRGGCAV